MKNLEFILNDLLNKALITERIKQPNSNKIADFIIKYAESEQLNLHVVSNTFKAKIESEILMFETKLKEIKDDVEMAFTKPDQWTEEINLINGRIHGLNSALNCC